MVLYDVRVGNNIVDDSWEFITDEFGNNFITKPSIYQRLRIDKTIEGIEPKVVEASWKSNDAVRYEFLTDKKLRWANNNKNMNPILLVDENASDLSICYVTLSEDYILLRYRTSAEILQTFHKKNASQGCCVVFDEDKLTKGSILQLQIKEKKTSRYLQVYLNVENGEVKKIVKPISDKKVLATLRAIKKPNNFKIQVKSGLMTLAYIVTNKEQYESVINEEISNPIIYEYIDGLTSKDLEEDLSSFFGENRIRAVTLMGMDASVLNKDLVRNLRLLYIFEYNDETNSLICKRSN
jgi:hypothetical protein